MTLREAMNHISSLPIGSMSIYDAPQNCEGCCLRFFGGENRHGFTVDTMVRESYHHWDVSETESPVSKGMTV
jgi:hypothetical protein